ncbi:hypothetical protein NHQ30_005701 [Ciborinia camelliae]|nr:hypothetical protein NHQ30_005701 [Ciborinia camelliae]
MVLSRPEPSSMRGHDEQPAKRRKYPLSRPAPTLETIRDLMMDFKPSQLRQVIDVALNGGDVKRYIQHIHARLPRKSPYKDQSEPLAAGCVPAKDEVVQSIEIYSPLPERHAPVPAPQEAEPPLQPFPAGIKDGLHGNGTRLFVHLSKVATNEQIDNLPTPRNLQGPLPKEIPMTPDPYLTPEPEFDTHPTSLPKLKTHIRPPPPTVTCNCRSGCTSTRCKCYRSGRGCLPSPFSGCKCESCINMLNDLSSFFGSPKPPGSPVTANIAASPDLLKWIRKESRNGRFDLFHPDTIEELRSMLMGVEYGRVRSSPTFAVFSSGKLAGIRRAWMRADITDDERDDVKKELFKEAFGVTEGEGKEPKEYYWCFCTNSWEKTVLWEYCTKCDMCRNVRERHCE